MGSQIPQELLPYLLGEKTDYSSLQDSIIRVNVVCIALIVVTTSLRFYVRFRMLRSAGLDDIFMIAALIFALLQSAACLTGEYYGIGKHLWNLDKNLLHLAGDVGRVTKSLFGAYLAYSSAVTFTKFSIMAMYSRILPPGGLRTAVYASGVVVFLFWFISIFAIIFTCVPVQAAWDYTIRGARCYPIVKYFYVASSFNIATDLLLCFLPMPTLWRLQMPKPQRVVLCVLFTMGTFACLASIIRMTQLHSVGGYDVPYQSVTTINWSVIEVDVAIMCASISALRPLATRYLPNVFSQFSNMDASYNSATAMPISLKKGIFLSSGKDRSESSAESASQIYIQRSFDVSELDDWPATSKGPRVPEKAMKGGAAIKFEGCGNGKGFDRLRDVEGEVGKSKSSPKKLGRIGIREGSCR